MPQKTLLDEFAMAAFAGVFSNNKIFEGLVKTSTPETFNQNLCKYSYEKAQEACQKHYEETILGAIEYV